MAVPSEAVVVVVQGSSTAGVVYTWEFFTSNETWVQGPAYPNPAFSLGAAGALFQCVKKKIGPAPPSYPVA